MIIGIECTFAEGTQVNSGMGHVTLLISLHISAKGKTNLAHAITYKDVANAGQSQA